MDPPETFKDAIRSELAEITEELLSDETIVRQLRKAWTLIKPWVTDDDELSEHCLVSLGTYFSYIAYTSLAEREQGTLPVTSVVRIRELKHIAYLFLSQIVPVDENLVISPAMMQGVESAVQLVASELDQV